MEDRHQQGSTGLDSGADGRHAGDGSGLRFKAARFIENGGVRETPGWAFRWQMNTVAAVGRAGMPTVGLRSGLSSDGEERSGRDGREGSGQE
ncbi:hypothetical protein M0R45_016103 [Rubus argutus]|uniref:Uncharacterized protein n=1 Tax=Rubus argutus TaxID=59490 RepID=A0AAW1XV85_RUBAR